MNKLVLYVGLAILLGTVSMIAPLALLKDDNPLSEDKFLVTTSGGALENQTREYSNNNETLGLDSTSDYLFTPPPAEPQFSDSEVVGPEEVKPTSALIVDSDEPITDLSPIALITVPSFLIALGVFVLLRRQVS